MKKAVKKCLAYLLVLSMVVGFGVFPNQIEASSISLNKTSVTLKVGKTCKLKVKGTTKKVKWASKNKSIATVTKSGKVKAKRVGKTTITAKVSGKTLKCKVTVKKASTGHTVYVTPTGKCYHYNNHCNGGTYYKSTLKKAKARGLRPCKKCVK